MTAGCGSLGAFWSCLQIIRRRRTSAVLRHGRLCVLSGGVMASSARKPLMHRQCRRVAPDEQQGALPVTDRIAFGSMRRRTTRTQRDRHRQPGACEDRGDRRTVQRYAGRVGACACSSSAAAWARKCQRMRAQHSRCSISTSADGHAPDRQANLESVQSAYANAHVGAGAAVHRRHGEPSSPSAT